MTDLFSYWEITALVIGEELPGVTFSVFIGDGDDAAADGYYFELQRFVNDQPDEQNVRNGTDSYCVVNESGGVHFGGLNEVSLVSGLLTLSFTEEAAGVLDLPSNVIPLGVGSGVDLNELRAGLYCILTYGNPQRFPRLDLG
ncbi:Imm10 family immunity protein [Streptomyces sp. AS58]|uniref:Imm10 family immunity protein n=1 Tax=Streptomyces sp. AS58 TaxID=1519489 RepID=UPI000AE5B72C|nr:Imm10 family immunity protein [Streptomyces sp. AS58]